MVNALNVGHSLTKAKNIFALNRINGDAGWAGSISGTD